MTSNSSETAGTERKRDVNNLICDTTTKIELVDTNTILTLDRENFKAAVVLTISID
jgi:hypothetical protein